MYVFEQQSCFKASHSNPTSFLKANILIDQDRHARLADFGLLTAALDSTNQTALSSYTVGGTIPWMSPELLTSDQTGLMNNRPTKQSDCYALGMVIYEVLSGQAPFAPLRQFAAMWKIMSGERPQRPGGVEGAQFTDDLWRTLNQCWTTLPESRPNGSAVLECLERVSGDTKPPCLGGTAASEGDLNLTESFSGMFSWFALLCFVALLYSILR